MRSFILSLLIATCWCFFGLKYYMCNVKGLCDQHNSEIVKINPDNFLAKQIDGINVYQHHDSISFDSDLDSLKSVYFYYLNNHLDEEMVIYGFATKKEPVTKGLNRGERFKKFLVDYGVNPNKIRVTSYEHELAFDSLGIAQGGILIDFEKIDSKRQSVLERDIVEKVLHSNFSSEDFIPDNSLLRYTAELKNYLSRYPEAKVLITGHTDNIGAPEVNKNLGLRRAQQVQDYMVLRGLLKDKIEIRSFGEEKPIATNATEAGRKTNRRIEIVVFNNILE